MHCDGMWCAVMGCGAPWCDVTHCAGMGWDALCCSVMWCNVMGCAVMRWDGMGCVVMWCDALWCDALWCAVIRCDVMRCPVLWCAVLCCDVNILIFLWLILYVCVVRCFRRGQWCEYWSCSSGGVEHRGSCGVKLPDQQRRDPDCLGPELRDTWQYDDHVPEQHRLTSVCYKGTQTLPY